MNESTWSSWQEGAGEPRWVGGGVAGVQRRPPRGEAPGESWGIRLPDQTGVQEALQSKVS